MSEWVEQYTDDLCAWAYYKTSDSELAQDLVQETFLAAWKNIEGFEGKSKPLTWLKSILNNKIVDYYRKNGKVILESMDQFAITNESPSNELFDSKGLWVNNIHPSWEDETHLLDNAEFRNVFDACIDSLPENAKFAILSKYIFEKKAEEVCQELNISTTNYWQLIHRAKIKLKKCLDSNWSLQ